MISVFPGTSWGELKCPPKSFPCLTISIDLWLHNLSSRKRGADGSSITKDGADTYEIVAGHNRDEAAEYLVEEEKQEQYGVLVIKI